VTRRSRTSRTGRIFAIAIAILGIAVLLAYSRLVRATTSVAPATAGARSPTVAAPSTSLRHMDLTDEQRMYVVGTKQADGTIVFEHVTGKTAADERVRASATAPAQSGKAVVHDR
jgi:hypothetical protein